MRLSQLPGKGTSRPRLPGYLRPTRRLVEPRRPQEAPGGQAGREELALAHLGGARGPTGTKSGGARPAGRRLGSGASPARSPALGGAPNPKLTQQNPEGPRRGTDFRANRADVIPLPEEVASSRPALGSGAVGRGRSLFTLSGDALGSMGWVRSSFGRAELLVHGQGLQAEGRISRSPERAEVRRGVQRRILPLVQGSARENTP